MSTAPKHETRIGVTAFKSKCLGLIDEVAQGKTGRILLLKRNRPIAAIVPLAGDVEEEIDLWGAMRGTATIPAEVDLTAPVGAVWDALQEP